MTITSVLKWQGIFPSKTLENSLGATFKQKKKVIELLRLSKQKGPNNENFVNDDGCHSGEDDDDEEVSGVDDLCSSSCSEMEMSLFKETFIQVLKSTAFEDKSQEALQAV